MRCLLLLCLLSCAALGHHYQRGREIILHDGSIDTTSEPSFLDNELHKRHISSLSESTESQYLVHVAFPLKDEGKEAIERYVGARLGVYLPHNTYLLVGTRKVAERAAAAPGVHWVGALLPEHKYPRSMRSILEARSNSFDIGTFVVHLFPELPEHAKRDRFHAQSIASRWKGELSGAKSIGAVSKDKIVVTLDTGANAMEVVEWLANRPESHWIEPGFLSTSHNSYVGSIVQSNYDGLPFFANGIDGTDQIVGLADSGIQYQSCYFPGNVVPDATNAGSKIVKYVTTYGDALDADGHGTHVAGTIAGNTNNNVGSAYNGIAPGARIHFTDISKAANVLSPPADLKDMLQNAFTDGARLFVASFGTSNVTWYSSQARDIDTVSSNNKDLLVIVSAGNEGTSSSLSSLALSKNALVVGACQSVAAAIGGNPPPVVSGTSTLASFTSRGPTPDGRIKPDVVAPAQSIVSASNTPAGAQCAQSAPKQGTSYAAGVAGGAAALVRHWFASGQYSTDGSFATALSGDVVKAVLINSGQPLQFFNPGRGNYLTLKQFPSSDQGFGRIQLDAVLPLPNRTTASEFFVLRNSISTGGTTRYCFKVDQGASFVKATLVWHDPAGSLTSGLPLVNNLDMVIVNQKGVAFKSDTANGGFDAVNNVEQILLENPPRGTYAIYIHGFNVPQGGSQQFALVLSGNQTFAFCDVEFDDPSNPICPNGCAGRGTCQVGGTCNCTNPAIRGVDCSADPCPQSCNSNGVCDYSTGTCLCKNGYAPPNCATLLPPTSPPQQPPAEVITVKGDSGIDVGLFIGVVIAAFVVGCLCALVIGGFGAVRFLEYKRDQAHKYAQVSRKQEAEHSQDHEL